MNISYVHLAYERTDTCWCGHGRAVHTFSGPTTDSCTQCLTTLGTAMLHSFTSRTEANPKNQFSQCAPRGYSAAGGVNLLGKGGQPTNIILLGSTIMNAGQSQFSFGTALYNQLAVPMVPGDTLVFKNLNSSLPRQDIVRVVGVNPQTPFPATGPTVVNFLPPLRFGWGGGGPATQIYVFGADGSTQGPGLPSNGQRAG